MTVSRADKYTQLQKKQELYSDFLINFDKHPLTNKLARVTNEDSVKQGLRNLILTQYGERFFNSNFGSDVTKSLFDNFDQFAADNIKQAIKTTVTQKAPRVQLLDISVSEQVDVNTFSVTIIFATINNPEPQTLDLILRRVR